MGKHSHLWNDMTYEERHRLMPHHIETHILQLEQSKGLISRNHKRTIVEINDHIRNLKSSLAKLEAE